MAFPILSTLVLVLIFIGLWKRKVNRIHIPAMLAAFVIDLGMVLWLELNRLAVEQVIEGVSGLLAFHVTVSIIVMLLYIALIISGYKIWKGERALFNLHRYMAAIFIIGRLINYVTAFYVGSA
jgi:hypothetical protein